MKSIIKTFFKSLSCVLIFTTSPYLFAFESGAITVTDSWRSIDASAYTDPVIIAGVATRNDAEPGVISVVKDSNGDFLMRFREWDYLDGVHAEESVSYVLVEKGHTLRADGTVIEAGTFNLGSSNVDVFFSQEFEQTPLVFLSAQSENDPSTYSLRVEGVTRHSFSAELEEQELNGSGGHVQEEIAYLAISSVTNGGQLDVGGNFLMSQAIVNSEPTSTAGGQIFLEEEQSQDAEIFHIDEVVSILQTAQGLLGQTTTIYGGNTENVALASMPETGAQSCAAILNADPTAPSGYYTLDVDGIGVLAPFSTYCDMDFDGGGWTLVSVARGTQRIEASDISHFSSDQHLSDSVWQAFKALSSEIYVYGYLSGRWVVAPFANITSGVCVPLSDSLAATRIFHAEISGCNGIGTDYSIVGQSGQYDGLMNIWNFHPSVYSSTSGFTGTGQTDGVDIYVR